MASDRIVTAQHVLHSVMELQRRGSRPIMSELESLEPDLMEYILESLTQLHHKLADAGLAGSEVRKLYRRAETIVLVGVMALRKAHRDLWENDLTAPAADPIEPSVPPASPDSIDPPA